MLDVVRALAHVLELLVQDVRSLDGGLGVCLRDGGNASAWGKKNTERRRLSVRNSAGNEILKRTFSMMLYDSGSWLCQRAYSLERKTLRCADGKKSEIDGTY